MIFLLNETVVNAVFTVTANPCSAWITFLVQLYSCAVSVNFETVNGSALLGAYYTANPRDFEPLMVSWAVQTISVPIAHDGILRMPKSFYDQVTGCISGHTGTIIYSDTGTGDNQIPRFFGH